MIGRAAGQRYLRKLGLDARRLVNVPFGVDAFRDIASLAGTVSIAFDIGANEGQTVARMRRAFPDAQIFSFEPVPSTFAVLVADVAGDPHVTCVQSALGDGEGSIEITASATSGQNTTYLAAKPDSPTVTVPITTVDSFAARHGLRTIDVLKIDTEGHEPAVLRGARGLLEAGQVRFVLAECEFVANPAEPHGPFFELADMLLSMGYRIVAFYSGGVDGNGWRWGDTLFMRPDETRRDVVCSPYAIRR